MNSILNNMSHNRKLLYSSLSLFLLISPSLAASDILLNGTNIYLATGYPVELYQGYTLNLKSVSNDGSAWLQLIQGDKIVKSDIVHDNGYFLYNRTNKTIISVKMEKVYSSSSEQKLVSFSIYQFIDPEIPVPDRAIIPENTINPDNSSSYPKIYAQGEPVIWILGIYSALILFYVLRKLW